MVNTDAYLASQVEAQTHFSCQWCENVNLDISDAFDVTFLEPEDEWPCQACGEAHFSQCMRCEVYFPCSEIGIGDLCECCSGDMH